MDSLNVYAPRTLSTVAHYVELINGTCIIFVAHTWPLISQEKTSVPTHTRRSTPAVARDVGQVSLSKAHTVAHKTTPK